MLQPLIENRSSASASCSSVLSSTRRLNVILRARNPFKEAQLDMISGLTPNTPVRRLSYTIKHAISLQDLSRLVKRNRQKMTGGVWLDKHEAAVLARAADLGFARAMHGTGEGSRALAREALEELMTLSARRSLRPPVMKLLEGRTILRLLSCLAHAECTPSRLPIDLLTALVLELTRGSGNKLPKDGASMAELYWCISVLGLLPSSNQPLNQSLMISDDQAVSLAPGPRDSLNRHHHLQAQISMRLVREGSGAISSAWMELDRCALLALQQELVSSRPKMELEDLSKFAWTVSTTGRIQGSLGEDLMGCIEKISLMLLPEPSDHKDHQPHGGITELEGREARLVANLAYAFAKGGRRCPLLMSRLSQVFNRHLSRNEGRDTSEPFLSPAAKIEPVVSGSSIAKIMWAMASLGHKDSSLIHRLSTLIVSPSWLAKLHLTGDDLAHITWALSTLQHHKPQVFEALGKAFVGSRMYGASDRQLAMISTSFVALASSPSISSSVVSGVYRTISRLASGRASTMQPEDLITIAWALVSAKEPNALLLEMATKAAISSLHASSSSPSALKPSSIARLTSALQQSKENRLLRDLTSALHSAN
jgi:hypothetical protein